jgi:RNA polymerase sigma-70 factor (ECF subfamily)
VPTDPASVARLDQALADARAANDFATIDELLAPVVADAAAGDQASVDLLLRCISKHRLVAAPIRKLLIDEGDVEDATQQTLMAVNRAIGGFEARSRFTTWLYRIAEREALQVLRRNQRVSAPEGDDLGGLAAEVRRMSSVVASAAMLRQVLESLPPRLRDPVVLCDVDGLDYATIAERLDLPLGTVKTNIRRGRQAVADAVMAQLAEPQPPEGADAPPA